MVGTLTLSPSDPCPHLVIHNSINQLDNNITTRQTKTCPGVLNLTFETAFDLK